MNRFVPLVAVLIGLVAGCEQQRPSPHAVAPKTSRRPAASKQAAPHSSPPQASVPQSEELGDVVVVANQRIVIRDGPSVDRPDIGLVSEGERLRAVRRQGDWYEIRFGESKRGFVNARFVDRAPESDAAVPCPPDSPAPRLLTTPPLSMATRGTIYMNLSVNERGRVIEVTVTANTTGDEALRKQAIDEALKMQFEPMYRGCKARPFIYLFNRSF